MVATTPIRKGPLRRYVFRKDFVRKVRARLQSWERHLLRNEFRDTRYLFQGELVKTVFDVGANVGYVTDIYRRYFADATIYSFEPTPETFQSLKRHLSETQGVQCFQYAVTDKIGDLQFYLSRNSGVCSLLEPNAYNAMHWAWHKLEPVSVPAVTLDSFCQEHGINAINLLKLDIEDSELSALKGAENLLKASAIDVIYTEVNFLPLYKGQPLLHQLSEFLYSHDYTLYNIYNIVESPIRQGIFTNALFLSPAMRNRLLLKYGKANCGW